MLDVTLKVDLDGLIDEIGDLAKKQLPFASMLALNETVFKTSVKVKNTMPHFIQGGPVAFTKRGVQYSKAKSKLNLYASVFIPDEQWKFMRWVIDGGSKKWSRSKAGIGIPVSVKLNKYGNIPGRARKEKVWRTKLNVLSVGETATGAGLGKNEFVGTVGGITGVWKRLGKDGRSKLKLLVSFTNDAVDYKKTFPFRKFATQFGGKIFKRSFNEKFRQVVNRELSKVKVK